MLFRQGLLGRAPCPQDWYAGSGPPTIDENFTTAIPSGWIFSRNTGASNCLYTDTATAPAYTAYAANVPRFLDFGLLMEPQRTNLFLNSEAPVTQTITVAIGDYVLWYLGPVASSVNMVLGTAVGSGFNPQLGSYGTIHITTAGTITVNCVSSPTRVQLEAGLGPTSYIASTATAQTRQEDRLYKNYLGGQLNVNEGTYWVEWSSQYPVSVAGLTRLFTAGIGSYSSDANTDQAIIFSGSPYVFSAVPFDGTSTGKAQSAMFGPRPLGAVSRTAVSMSLHRCKIAQDYALDVNPPQDPNFRPPTLLAVTLFGGGNNVPMNGFLRGFRYWPVAMPDAELKECTEPGYYQCPPVFTFDLTTGVLPRRMTYVRGAQTGVSTDGYSTDAAGSSYNTFAAPPAPRFSSRGLMLEVARNNLLASSNVPVTRASGSLGANQGYKLWVIGTGSVTVTPGTTTADFAGNNGVATQGNPLFVQCTVAGTVTCTVTGTVNRFQLEQMGNNTQMGSVTSFIQTSAANQTRGSENLNMLVGPWFARDARTYYLEMWIETYANTGTWMACGSADNVEREHIFISAPTPTVANSTVNFTTENRYTGSAEPDLQFTGIASTAFHRIYKFAISQSLTNRSFAMNGQVVSGVASGVLKPMPVYLTLNTVLNNLASGYGSNVYRKFAFYDYALSDAQLVALTGGAALDVSFLTGTLDPRITFARSSIGTYFDSTGSLQTAANDVPRFDYDPVTLAPRGLLIEEARTNLLLNSLIPSTQSVAVTAQAYTLSFYGTGTITLSGASTIVLAGGATTSTRVERTFTPTAGTLTLTITGSVRMAQLEVGGGATSFIATGSTAVTRSADNATASLGTVFNPSASTHIVDCMVAQSPNPSNPNARTALSLSDGSASNIMRSFAQINNQPYAALGTIVSGATTTGTTLGNPVAGATMKLGGAWDGSTMLGALNGGTPVSQSVGMPTNINVLTLGGAYVGSSSRLNGWITRIRYWPYAMNTVDLQTVTT